MTRAKTTRENLDEFDTPEWRAANTWVWRNAPHGGTRYQDAKLRYQTAVARIAELEAERDEAKRKLRCAERAAASQAKRAERAIDLLRRFRNVLIDCSDNRVLTEVDDYLEARDP